LKISFIIFFGLTFLALIFFIVFFCYFGKEDIKINNYVIFYLIFVGVDALINIILTVIIFNNTVFIRSKLNFNGCDEYTNELFKNLINDSFLINFCVSLSIIILLIIAIIYSIILIVIKKKYKID